MSYHDDFENDYPEEYEIDQYYAEKQLYQDIENQAKKKIWITKDGTEIPVSKMTTSHICNTINWIKKNNKYDYYLPWLSVLENELMNRNSDLVNNEELLLNNKFEQSLTNEISTRVEESEDEFIFTTLKSFCEGVVKTKISKEDLKQALLKYYKKEESCEDAISRQAVLDFIKKVCFSREQKWVDFRISQGSNGQRDLIIKFIEGLSSIQPKTGHWIEEQKGLHVTCYKCSECGRIVRDDTGYDVNVDYPFCHCGAKMIKLQESESKNNDV